MVNHGSDHVHSTAESIFYFTFDELKSTLIIMWDVAIVE